MWTRLIFGALLVVHSFGEAPAQSHLVPETTSVSGVLAAYDAILIETFRQKEQRSNTLCRMLLRPAFDPEWLTGIRRTEGGRYEAFSVRAETNMWYAGFRDATPENVTWSISSARDVELHHHAAEIDSSLAYLLHHAWTRAILEVRYPDRYDFYEDGINATFWTWSADHGIISGFARNPSQGSTADAIMRLGILIGRLARNEDVDRNEIAASAHELLTSLAE